MKKPINTQQHIGDGVYVEVGRGGIEVRLDKHNSPIVKTLDTEVMEELIYYYIRHYKPDQL